MSFALEFRKKLQADARKTARTKRRAKKKDEGFVVLPAKRNTDTRSNCRSVLAALSLAGIILSVFNSGAMVQYAGGLGYNDVSMKVINASERWHHFMEQNRMTVLVEEIRGAVAAVRESNWQDFAFGTDAPKTHPWPVTPATAHPETQTPAEPVPVEVAPEPEQAPSNAPVMRAAVESRGDGR